MFRDLPLPPRRALARRAAAILVAAAAAFGGVGSALAQPKVLTVGNPFAPLSLDPALSGNGRAGTHLMPAYEPLVRTRPDGSFEPALATAWSMSNDLKEATFTLRRDAKFSDGEPVTAEAVKKSIEYFVGRKGPFSVNLATLAGIDVLDSHRVRIRVSQPNPALLNLFDGYFNSGLIISPKVLGTPDLIAQRTFGAGPYKLDPAATVTGKSYTYVPNEHYYDKSRIKWDRVVMSVFEDQNSAIQAMKAGQLKFLVSDPITGFANAGKLEKNMKIISDPVQWVGLILMDRGGIVNPALKDQRVRQAINHAIDRPLVAKALLGPFADPTTQLQGDGFLGFDAPSENRYPYDIEKAKALLAAAGHPRGLDLKIDYVNNTLSRTLAQALSGQLRKAGINVKLNELQNFGAMLAASNAKTIESLVFNSNAGVPHLARFQTLAPKGSLNFYGSEDATLNKLVDEALALPMARSEAAWRKVYAHVVELAWFAPVAATHTVYFHTDDVKAPKVGQSIVIDLINVVPAQ